MRGDGDDGPELPSPRVRAGCLLAGIVLTPVVAYFALVLMLGPSLWKTEIGKVKLGNGTTITVGRMHDGEFTYEYYVKVGGKNCKAVEWTYFGSSPTEVDDCEVAWTADSRFTGIALKKRDGAGPDSMVIYDAVEDELSRSAGDDWRKEVKFVKAWRELREVNGRLPEGRW
ncbi:hypothetical protein [Luteolibacter soli]|uniref:DUF3592 domain-containing protein n=1 Tax=Luteolibacter soli TaxID=3135280 RepID=A0ABU9AY54_9BACT